MKTFFESKRIFHSTISIYLLFQLSGCVTGVHKYSPVAKSKDIILIKGKELVISKKKESNVGIYITDGGGEIYLETVVINKSKININVRPEEAIVIMLESNGSKYTWPIIEPELYIKSIREKAANKAALSSVAGSLATKTSTEEESGSAYVYDSGRSASIYAKRYKTKTEPDEHMRDMYMKEAGRILVEGDIDSREAEENMLWATTVEPNKILTGRIVAKKEHMFDVSEIREVFVDFKVGDEIHSFEFNVKRLEGTNDDLR